MTHRILWPVLAAVALAAVTASLTARTQTFLETNRDQFDEGEFDRLVATSLGRLRLGRALDDLLAETQGVDYIARCARAPDGTVYAVTGGTGRIYAVKGGKVTLYATLDDPFLFSVVVEANGDLYVGSGGAAGRVWRVAPPEGDRKEPQAQVLFEDEAVQYVWDLAWMADGSLAAATGPEGHLLRIQPDGEHNVLVDSQADHVLCLAVGPDARLYAGTDGEAMVYRWADGKPFVLYDADEAEVTALATDADGNLYVGTSSGRAGRAAGVQPQPQPQPPQQQQQGNGNGNGNGPGTVDSDGDDEEGTADDAAADDSNAGAQPASAAMAEARKLAHTVQAARKANGGTGNGGAGGASVYRITPDGLATPLFDAEEGLLLALAVDGDRLLVGTGDPGRLYEVNLARDGEEQATLATVDPKQIMAIAVPDDGRPIVATAGPGRLYVLSDGYARQGTYTSQVYDAGGSARWGAMAWRGTTPDGTTVRLATRTGNVADPEKGLWSDWSKDLAKPRGAVGSPPARYIQFRVAMETDHADRTPVLEQFEAAYLRANEPPRVVSIAEIVYDEEKNRAQAVQRFRQAMRKRATSTKQQGGRPPRPPAPEGSQPIRVVQWDAEDPNGDTLRYALYFRGQGETKWIRLEDDLARPEYAWNTNTVADGWYELKVVATDRLDNPADVAGTGERVSDPVLVDNTAPVIENVKAKLEQGEDGKARAVVTFTAKDATSRLAEAAYTVDAATDWQAVGPEDGLLDTPTEAFRFVAQGLGPGPHRIGIRVVDEANNHGHAAVTVVVE
ncbi:MAG: hypothetical protein R6X20_00975 [Phycisphaerae bacterium]